MAQVSLEVEHYGSQGLRRKRMSLSLDLSAPPKWPEAFGRVRFEPDSTKLADMTGRAIAADEFERAVAKLESKGYGRERARHLIAIRMKFSEDEIARLRENAC
jgi:hypothetical protein